MRIEEDKVFEKVGIELVEKVIIPQSATEVVSQVLLLKKAKPDYILTVLSGKPSAVFLKDAYKAGIKSKITVFSVSGNYDLLRLAKNAARGVLMTSPFVFGNNADVPGIAEILNYYKKHHTDWEIVRFDYVSGWVNGMILTEAARRAGDNLTGDGMRIGLESLKDFQTGGLSNPVTFSSSQHKGSNQVKILEAEPNKMTFKALTGWVGP
jgi:branched-chain amino acid transport system substrate-binding protein